MRLDICWDIVYVRASYSIGDVIHNNSYVHTFIWCKNVYNTILPCWIVKYELTNRFTNEMRISHIFDNFKDAERVYKLENL